MKKFFSFVMAALCMCSVSAQESKVLFDNPDAPVLSWSVACSVSAAEISGVKAGDIFEVTVADVLATCDWPKFGFESGANSTYPTAFEMWTHRTELPYVAKYTVTDDALASIENGFELKGDGVKVTKVVYTKTVSEEVPEGQTILFSDEAAPMLSWSVACTVPAAKVADIKAGDVIEVTVAERQEGNEWPKFGFEANGKDNYPEAFQMWGDKTFPCVAKYVVTEADVDLLKGGFDIKGDGVRITKVVYIKTVSEELPEGHSVVFNNPDAPMLSWSVLCSVTAAQVEGIKAGDSFVVTVAERQAGNEWPKFGFEANGKDNYPEEFQMWGDKTFPYEATYYVTAEDVELLKGGFDIKGDGVRITRVEFVSAGDDDNTELVLWQGEPTVMTWGAGPTVAAGKAATIETGDAIVITITELTGTSQWPKIVCRSEDGWEEIFTINLWETGSRAAEAPMTRSVVVTEEMLPLLAPGFNFGGEGASIEKVVLVKKPSGVDNVAVDAEPSVANVYTINGVCVRSNVSVDEATVGLPAGLYIVNGKKILVK